MECPFGHLSISALVHFPPIDARCTSSLKHSALQIWHVNPEKRLFTTICASSSRRRFFDANRVFVSIRIAPWELVIMKSETCSDPFCSFSNSILNTQFADEIRSALTSLMLFPSEAFEMFESSVRIVLLLKRSSFFEFFVSQSPDMNLIARLEEPDPRRAHSCSLYLDRIGAKKISCDLS